MQSPPAMLESRPVGQESSAARPGNENDDKYVSNCGIVHGAKPFCIATRVDGVVGRDFVNDCNHAYLHVPASVAGGGT